MLGFTVVQMWPQGGRFHFMHWIVIMRGFGPSYYLFPLDSRLRSSNKCQQRLISAPRAAFHLYLEIHDLSCYPWKIENRCMSSKTKSEGSILLRMVIFLGVSFLYLCKIQKHKWRKWHVNVYKLDKIVWWAQLGWALARTFLTCRDSPRAHDEIMPLTTTFVKDATS